jgi:hypothetical protein
MIQHQGRTDNASSHCLSLAFPIGQLRVRATDEMRIIPRSIREKTHLIVNSFRYWDGVKS